MYENVGKTSEGLMHLATNIGLDGINIERKWISCNSDTRA